MKRSADQASLYVQLNGWDGSTRNSILIPAPAMTKLHHALQSKAKMIDKLMMM